MTETRVLTIGTFDVLHFGHVAFLRQCERLGTSLTVGVNSDAFTMKFKGRPVMTETERAHAIRLLGYRVEINRGPGRDLIQSERPDVLAVGSDWARKDYRAQIDMTQTELDSHLIIVAYVPYVQQHAISTTEIRRRIMEGHECRTA